MERPKESWSEQQKRDYIQNAEDNLLIIAGPGIGKTTLLSRRIPQSPPSAGPGLQRSKGRKTQSGYGSITLFPAGCPKPGISISNILCSLFSKPVIQTHPRLVKEAADAGKHQSLLLLPAYGSCMG